MIKVNMRNIQVNMLKTIKKIIQKPYNRVTPKQRNNKKV